MKRTPHLLALVLLAACASGCVGARTQQVELAGTLHRLGDDEDQPLSFDQHGRPRIYDRPVELPRGQEDRRYGVVLIDVAPLPEVWRPSSAPQGGVVVSAVDLASPLAIAGLRCGDRITAVDERPVKEVAEVERALWERERISLSVVHLDGREAKVVAEACQEGVRDVSHWSIPAVVTYAGSTTGGGFKLGPLGWVFNARSAYVTDGKRYLDRTEWGVLLDLIAWESETDPLTGESQSRLRLFWFLSLGSDLFPG